MQKYKNILITGANSFLGTNVVLELSRRGLVGRAFVRHTNATLDELQAVGGVQIVRGDVSVVGDLVAAAAGCDCIVHIAAITDQALPRYEMYRSFNVGSLENVIAAARACGIGRVVFVSSANTIGNGTTACPADETFAPAAPFATTFYGRSKVEAQDFLESVSDIDWTIVNPAFMLGAYDSKPSSGQIILMGYGRRVIFCSSGGKNIVSVEAVAGALCNAVECGRRGEKYLLSGVDISLRDFFRVLNPGALIVTLPTFLLVGAGYLGDLARFCGVHTSLSVVNMRVVCSREYYSSGKAAVELGLAKTSVEDCIDKAVSWLASISKL